MAEPQTFAELQTAITTWMIRDDLDDMAASFIGMAERRLNRALRVPEMEADATATVTSGLFTLPDDFLALRSVYVDASPSYPLTQVGLAQLQDMYGGLSGIPAHFAMQSGSEMILGPSPTDSTALLINYYAKIPALSESQTANWLLTAHPDLYLAASLVEGFTYTRDLAGMQVWQARSTDMIADLEKQGRKKAHGGTLVRRARNVA